MNRFRLFGLFVLSLTLNACAQQQKTIHLNQLGFYPEAPKVAIIGSSEATDFQIVTADGSKILLRGKLSTGLKSQYSGKIYKEANFSSFKSPGKYILVIPGVGKSSPFEIRRDVFSDLSKAVIKNYYFQRMSIPLQEAYAGKWARPAGHPDTHVIVHASAASPARAEGSIISAPRGWYDAGDYNKYVVNSGITMGTMFSAYEDFTEYYDKLSLNIPESKNALPDLIDEILWNLRWMLTMQDPADGGVYHKLTNPSFDGMMVMPHQANKPRYVVQKGTAAALNFAAVTAQAARILRSFENVVPGLADSCLQASRRAWKWSVDNPNVEYNQDEMNKKFDPDIVTGAYGDKNFSDEFVWAACELFATTGEKDFLRHIEPGLSEEAVLPSWNQVRLLGYYTMIRIGGRSDAESQEITAAIKKKVVAFGEDLIGDVDKQPFKTVMGRDKRDYIWGSSAVAANQGVALIQAYRITSDKKFLDYALSNLDYLLGRNATGYSFVTGFGSRTPMHPHHRPSEADGVAEPVPGMLSGGPNPGMQDKCNYPSTVPEEAFVDDSCSYASNEIAINWNAPLVYLVGALEALRK